ncbi:Gfo/Idh/MocA family oxidoreductase [Picosynechococcus sp. PCC 11901]|uniref:Gfo/Idh/MocA family protein n=1 Tax=Picosynechococcus sp. PCC 11901 TaxID=2579791 RepID=UPI0010FBCCB2|nr:Gfo/Idh/MocA family oxidoreductase [Picosynechococcus sp. PCC 11901]QCS48157.1 Gfo/Idh/MocA family oxidoreductase [Picosynechococcus sp. PCC 11901]
MAKFRVGIVGTGYAAKRRAEAFLRDGRAELMAVAGQWQTAREQFASNYDLAAIASWENLIQRDDLDLIVVCTVNRRHGAVVRAALEAGKHVVVEYPLSLDPTEAAELIQLAQAKKRLLHVEHIELLGGLHQTIRRTLPELGAIAYGHYITLAPKAKTLPHWTYHYEDYGFPFVAALSRVNRLLDLFGTVETVTGAAQFLPAELPGYYQNCLCTAQLKFQSGVIAHLTYGKGVLIPKGDRRFSLYGEKGTLEFNGNQGTLSQGDRQTNLDAGSRRGVFLQDTVAVLDHLTTGKPLYIQPEQSLYALQVAAQIQRAALGQT